MDWLWSSFGGDWGTLGPMLLQIIMIDIILAGDNAVVIALACRSLPPHQRKWGIILGAGVALAMRIAFTIGVTSLMGLPYLKLIGSILLIWIAIKLLAGEGDGEEIDSSTSLWGAIKTIAIADIVMSLDNVLAIAAAAKGNFAMIVLGLAITVPLIVFGATLVMWLLTKMPILVWGGAALLGWIAGEMTIQDTALLPYLEPIAKNLGMAMKSLEYVGGLVGIVIVVGAGLIMRQKHHDKTNATSA